MVGVINATFARRAFPNEDPIGNRCDRRADPKYPWVTIVGVIQDYRHYRLPEPMGPGLYFRWPPARRIRETVVIRVKSGDPTASCLRATPAPRARRGHAARTAS